MTWLMGLMALFATTALINQKIHQRKQSVQPPAEVLILRFVRQGRPGPVTVLRGPSAHCLQAAWAKRGSVVRQNGQTIQLKAQDSYQTLSRVPQQWTQGCPATLSGQ